MIPTSHPFTARHHRTRRSMAAAALGLTLFAGGCQNISTLTTAAAVAPQPQSQPEPQPQSQLQPPPVHKSEAEWRTDAESLASRYRAKPDDPAMALAYAQALRGSGQRTQAVSVLQQASFKHPHDTALLGAYGRALSDVGNFEQALEVLGRAHTPEQPDWRILSAQGAVLDQLGRHDEAQRYYSSALKIKPDDPGVLSNLGLSYALAKDLKNAEATLRRAAAGAGTDPHGCAKISLWWSACRAASAKPKASPVPICRPVRRPPTSPISAGCWPSRATRRHRRGHARSLPPTRPDDSPLPLADACRGELRASCGRSTSVGPWPAIPERAPPPQFISDTPVQKTAAERPRRVGH